MNLLGGVGGGVLDVYRQQAPIRDLTNADAMIVSQRDRKG
jgi:hypothetical protein